MAGGNFMNRVLHYVINELLVDRLANSHSFQRFAVKSSKAIQELSQKGIQKREELAEQLKKVSETWKSESSTSQFGD
ncbi:uncharacterized protein LOC131031612 isoform X2 [Cryptomeria japonica]|uniref:uncharacterized protein LOC131031612 isoform X2 n=1 Tax=Cryptomeria japonica TaxID=3369 RepID=UPI0025AD6B27|nr:uncharacterized protein LOC131031612 isoform X2 [Cryptomeria japonica]